MIKDTYQKIEKGIEVRANLIQLKSELKEESNRAALLFWLGNDFSVLEELLSHEDAKVRKNVALIMGILARPEFLDKLYDAYEKEEQLFVRSSYLTAFKELDYRSILPKLKERLEVLSGMEPDESDKKHISEEMRLLSDLIIMIEGTKKHTFNGYQEKSDIILLTNRNYKEVTLEQITSSKAKTFNAGIVASTDDLSEILPIRTYTELLFVLKDCKTCSADSNEAAKQFATSSLLNFLEKRHKGSTPFYFRIECKSKMPLDRKSLFTKRMAAELERLTNRSLINTTSSYEVELRLIENREGAFNVLIKLYTIPDTRFAYRINALPTSIHPVNAALCMELAKPYLKEEAQILDPFCGVGTMLIERHKLMKAYSMYGLDIFENAILYARENTEAAHTIAHYINRDFFDFKHEYMFDEIVTNLPWSKQENEEILVVYRNFLRKAKQHLKEDAILILHTHHRDYLKRAIGGQGYRMVKEFEISKVEGTYLFILSNE